MRIFLEILKRLSSMDRQIHELIVKVERGSGNRPLRVASEQVRLMSFQQWSCRVAFQRLRHSHQCST